MLDKARIDPGLIASLRERSRPLRPEASLTQPFTPPHEEVQAEERLQPLIADLIMRLERAEERLRQLENSHVGKEVAAHTLFLSTATGYTIIERDGPAPRPGDDVQLGDDAYRARRYRHSPFPADPRPCVIVEPDAT